MVLVDTSVWVAHFRDGNTGLEKLLLTEDVGCHPLIIGELACGNLKNRTAILSLLHSLPSVIIADHEEVLQFIENRRLMGRGLGYIDMHLLTSAKLSATPIWTLDKSFSSACSDLGIFFDEKSLI